MSRELAILETSAPILDIASHLVQTRGFGAFSYADIAIELHITKASLHYHFPTKAILGERLVERYHDSFFHSLRQIDDSLDDASSKLSAYIHIYNDVIDNDRMCLCDMLAAEYATLPDSIRDRVRSFFEANDRWLAAALLHRRAKKQLVFQGSPIENARLLVSTLEGAMLLARSHGDPARFRSTSARALAGFGVKLRKRPSYAF